MPQAWGGKIWSALKLFPLTAEGENKTPRLRGDWRRMPALCPGAGSPLNHRVRTASSSLLMSSAQDRAKAACKQMSRLGMPRCPAFILHKHLRAGLGRPFGTSRRADSSLGQRRGSGGVCGGVSWQCADADVSLPTEIGAEGKSALKGPSPSSWGIKQGLQHGAPKS